MNARTRNAAEDERAAEDAFCAAYDIRKFDQPSVTTDIVALTPREKPTSNYRTPTEVHSSILLIRRGGFPFKGSWALPGGFLRKTETVEQCANRELAEETGLRARALLPAGVYSAPGRDPRGWILSNAFLLVVPKQSNAIRAGDDAADARWCDFALAFPDDAHAVLDIDTGDGRIVEHLDVSRTPFDEVSFRQGKKDLTDRDGLRRNRAGHLAFDHAVIIVNALHRLRSYAESTRDYAFAFAFLPDAFTLKVLREVVEMMGGAPLSVPNFRRKVLPLVEETGDYEASVGHRPAQLFRRSPRP